MMKSIILIFYSLLLTGCFFQNNVHVTFRIDKAYFIGNRVDVDFILEQGSPSSSEFPPQNCQQALSFDSFSWVSDNYTINRAVTPQDPASMVLHVNTNFDFGTTKMGGSGGVTDVITYSFGSDQLAAIPISNSIFVNIINANSNISAGLQVYKQIILERMEVFRFQDTLASTTGYLNYRDIDMNGWTNLPIYVQETNKSSASTWYVDSSGNQYQVPTIFDSSIKFFPGTVVNLSNCVVPF